MPLKVLSYKLKEIIEIQYGYLGILTIEVKRSIRSISDEDLRCVVEMKKHISLLELANALKRIKEVNI